MAEQNLTEIIETAASTLEEATSTTETKETKEEAVKEETKEEPKEETKKPTLEEAEQEQALSLFRALKDPNRAADVIRVMAKEAGLLETKAEKKEAERTIEEIIKEGLGEEYEFLSEKLGPVIKQAVEFATKDIREKTDATEKEREAEKINREIESVLNKYADAAKLEPDVLALMNEILPSPGQKVDVYFERLLKIAAAERGITLRTKTAGEKIVQTRQNAAERLSAGGGKSDKSVTLPSTTMDLNAAIEMAMVALSKGE